MCDGRFTPVRFHEIDVASPPAPTDEQMRRVISVAAEDLGMSFSRMPSGAGHDAQDIATIAPTGMIFVPSQGGISHSPKEFTFGRRHGKWRQRVIPDRARNRQWRAGVICPV